MNDQSGLGEKEHLCTAALAEVAQPTNALMLILRTEFMSIITGAYVASNNVNAIVAQTVIILPSLSSTFILFCVCRSNEFIE